MFGTLAPAATTHPQVEEGIPCRRPGVFRSAVTTLACAGLGGALGGGAVTIAGTAGIGGAGRPVIPIDALVAVVVLGLGGAAALVLSVGCALLTITAFTQAFGRSLTWIETLAARLTPAVLRRAVAVTLGTGLGLVSASGVATASETDLGWEVTSDSSAAQTADEGPDRASPDVADPAPAPGPATTAPLPVPCTSGISVTATQTAAVAPSAADDPTAEPAADPTTAPGTVTVIPGDSLWAIAAAHLPPDPTDAAIAAAWPRWYAANRDVVGPDPDLIHPGQLLSVPLAEEPE